MSCDATNAPDRSIKKRASEGEFQQEAQSNLRRDAKENLTELRVTLQGKGIPKNSDAEVPARWQKNEQTFCKAELTEAHSKTKKGISHEGPSTDEEEEPESYQIGPCSPRTLKVISCPYREGDVYRGEMFCYNCRKYIGGNKLAPGKLQDMLERSAQTKTPTWNTDLEVVWGRNNDRAKIGQRRKQAKSALKGAKKWAIIAQVADDPKYKENPAIFRFFEDPSYQFHLERRGFEQNEIAEWFSIATTETPYIRFYGQPQCVAKHHFKVSLGEQPHEQEMIGKGSRPSLRHHSDHWWINAETRARNQAHKGGPNKFAAPRAALRRRHYWQPKRTWHWQSSFYNKDICQQQVGVSRGNCRY